MNREKIVFIFGAGASKDEKLPTQEELLKKYFELHQEDSLRDDLEQYFRKFFEINVDEPNNAKFPTFEEALGIVELATEKEETYGVNFGLEKLRKIRDFLILSMGIAIDKSKLNNNNTHQRLIRRLFRRGHFKQDEYGFISFNYDLLLDKALMGILEEDVYVDYGVEFTNEKEEFCSKEFQKWDNPRGKNYVTYLKPHGSFNWMCCPTCNSIYITGEKKGKFFRTGYLHDFEHCLKNDKSRLYCVIEPPSFFKKYKNIYLQNIWKKTYDLLIEANKILFIGYSLPDADIWLKYLLKRSFFQDNKKIIVINPDEEKVKPRYERLLGDVTFHPIKFVDFVGNHKKYMEI